MHLAISDQGSNGLQSNGAGNALAGTVPTYALSVGGTSISTPFSAANDSTLSDPLSACHAGRPGDALRAGRRRADNDAQHALDGRSRHPDGRRGARRAYAGALTQLIETVWNAYVFVADGPHEQIHGLHQQLRGLGRRRPHPAGAVLPERLRAHARRDAAKPQRQWPRRARRLGAGRRRCLLCGAEQQALRRRSSAPAVTGDIGTSAAAPLWATLDLAIQRHLPRPGAARARLLQRPALHRGGHRARLVQRHRARQQRQRLLLHGEKHRLQSPGLRHPADRLRLRRSAGLRPGERAGHAQRALLGAR